jgi:hypothetical protein
MKKKVVLALALSLVLSALILGVSSVRAGAPPTQISYQGLVKVSGVPYDGTGYFKFAIVNAATGDGTTYWLTGPEALTVSNGLFNFMLGSTTALPSSVLDHDPIYLRVWFSQSSGGPFQALEPNQRIGSVAYALRAERATSAGDADTLNGLYASAFMLYQRPIVMYEAQGYSPLAAASIGGRVGADAKAAAAPNRPPGYPHYRAFLSVSDTYEIRDMPNNFGISTIVPIISLTDKLIANNWYDLLDGNINQTLASAGVIPAGSFWWTGSNEDGSLSDNCSGWTSTGNGMVGSSDYFDPTWLSHSSLLGTNSYRLVCIAY